MAGTITLTTGALPAVTNEEIIDGSTAPGYTTQPVVEVNFNHFAGLQFNAGSAGSDLSWLSLVNASGAGVSLNASSIQLLGDYIGLELDGATVAANGGDGVTINSSSTGNTIQQNVISGNQGNGITLSGSSDNQLVNNFIGADATGTLNRGNSGDGILLTNSATGNTLGGTTSGEPPNTMPPDFTGRGPRRAT